MDTYTTPPSPTFVDDDLQLEVLIDHLGEALPPKWSTQTHAFGIIL